ncbi:MAG: alpha-L-arabinofuranosidase [Lachnospiraceae bacterium]|nr:alpha-L-arabinofuranosidase [Lachnospiraceae bacterium]
MIGSLIAQYRFDDEKNPGADAGGRGFTAKACGSRPPHIGIVAGRRAAVFSGGENGTSYFELPNGIFDGVNDETGITVTAWVNFAQGTNVWERVFDFGKGDRGPYLFLTRNFRGVCFKDGDLFADPVFTYPLGEWVHVAMSVSGTKNGTLGNAGPCIYVNGEAAANGQISQTASGTYKRLREWFATFADPENYSRNYIGRSQFAADGDFSGAIADFCIFKGVLGADEIVDMMCETLTDEQILVPAAERYLAIRQQVITEDIELPASLLCGRVRVEWESDRPELFDGNGKVGQVKEPAVVTLTAKLRLQKEISLPSDACVKKQFTFTVMPREIAPYTLTIHKDKPVLDISKTLYGLFYEDINNAADGGIYAEMVRNRSFEAFYFDTYDFHSGENGRSTGRNHTPLVGWYGDLDKLAVKNKGGLAGVFGQADPDGNVTYVEAADGAVISNRGFSDTSGNFAMHFVKGERYHFTVWAKADHDALLSVRLLDAGGNAVSETKKITISGGWRKYGEKQAVVFTAQKDCLGQLELSFAGCASIDMVSMFPEHVWGFGEEEGSASAHKNYLGNPNYRLRRDLVMAMKELHPAFLRFPGGCISEGSYIWDNVYDWKDSVDIVEKRKENFNVWGYMMTLGLGYMEYFQLAEDLDAVPLPVMACGVLCQARSDYANPAGGKLQEKYIANFTDLIDFAISTDFDKNQWAALRRAMGHEAPFALHYLGVGNENWGEEFYASFEEFYGKITAYMKKHYPDWELHIISTVGAQADDGAYENGWRYLSGNHSGRGAKVRFTDGEHSFDKQVGWYQYQKDFMETIADEHYYRSNEYLLENADRYNYYARAYREDGSVEDEKISKVFVGEYASSDKNTLAGAVAEAAVMTGFERNSDVVRLAATAPLFNKVLTDGTYRWTPDAIWFDDETVWRTPNYYVQKIFAEHLGDKLLHTEFSEYRDARRVSLLPCGGIELVTGEADLLLKKLTVTANTDGRVLFGQDFRQELDRRFMLYPHTWLEPGNGGLLLKGSRESAGLYLPGDFTNCTVTAVLTRVSGNGALTLGVGVSGIGKGRNAVQYVIGDAGKTSVRVVKDGVEGYALGDFSCGRAAGNLRAALDEEVVTGEEYTVTVNYGGVFEAPGKRMDTAESGCGYAAQGYGAYRHLICSHKVKGVESRVLDYKLEAYNRAVFHSVTADSEKVYTKLVNPDNYAKKVEIVFGGQDAAGGRLQSGTAKWICLTGDEALVHEPNVNKRGAERIVPAEKDIPVMSSKLTVTLPANSVSVVVTEK